MEFKVVKINNEFKNVVVSHKALIEAEKLKLENNHFYFLLLGELYKNIDNKKAKFNFQKAYSLSNTETEKQNIQMKIDSTN